METKKSGVSLDKAVHTNTFKEKSPLVHAVLRKLIANKNAPISNDGAQTINLPTQHELRPILADTIRTARDAEYAFEVLPDLEYVAQIAISGILSSKDLLTTSLVYECTSSTLPIELRIDLMAVIRRHFDTEYKLPSYLHDILYDTMFKTGSYAAAIVPESSVDTLINSGKSVSLENYEQTKTLFGNKGLIGDNGAVPETKYGLEALLVARPVVSGQIHVGNDLPEMFDKIRLLDNVDHLKLSKLQANMTRKKVAAAYDTMDKTVTALESFNDIENDSSRDITADAGKGSITYDANLFDRSTYKPRQIEELAKATDSKTPSMGHPLIQHLPSESVIPIHVPGDMKKHVAYLVMIDNVGNPVNRDDLMNSSTGWAWMSGNASSALISDVANGMGVDSTREKLTISKLTSNYADMVERDIISSLKNGAYGDTVSVTRPQEVYRMMMARALAKKGTQLLVIPAEQLTYFALDYNEYGVGVSLTEKNKTLIAARAALSFATTNTSLLNATRNMQYDVTLAAEDRAPEKTIDDIQQRILQGYATRNPFNGNLADLESYFTNAGISFNIEGNDYYPSSKVSVSDVTPDYKTPDQTTVDDAAKRNYRSFGIDPDLVMSANSIEFAAQITSKDLIATRSVCKTQEKLTPLLTHFTRNYTLSSGSLLAELGAIIKQYLTTGENKLIAGAIGRHLRDFINNLEVMLPPPDMTALAQQMESYKDFDEALTTILDVVVNDDYFSELDLGIDLARARALLGNYYRRQWFKDNGVMPDLFNTIDAVETRSDFAKMAADGNVVISELLMMAMKRSDGRVKTAAENMGGDAVGESDDSFADTDSADDIGGEEDDVTGGDEFEYEEPAEAEEEDAAAEADVEKEFEETPEEEEPEV